MKFFINYPFGNTELDAQHRNKKLFNVIMENGFNSRKIIETCLYKREPLKCIPFLERIEQSSHHHYSVCFCLLMEKAADLAVDKKVQIIRTILLELERIYSHVIYLNRIFYFTENEVLLNMTSSMKDSLLDCFEEITGHRMYGTSHVFGDTGFNLSSGNIKFINNTLEETKNNLSEIKVIINNNPSISSLFKDTATIPIKDLSSHKASGPFSWINKTNIDLRTTDPYLVYEEKEIQDILKHKYVELGNCILARTTSLLYDLDNSIKIINFLIQKYNPIYQRQNKPGAVSIPKGTYSYKIEAPRGLLEIHTDISKEGLLDGLKIISPSDTNKKILNNTLKGTLTDSAGMAFESLYLSTMEIDK